VRIKAVGYLGRSLVEDGRGRRGRTGSGFRGAGIRAFLLLRVWTLRSRLRSGRLSGWSEMGDRVGGGGRTELTGASESKD
jgi:hypothetical protein